MVPMLLRPLGWCYRSTPRSTRTHTRHSAYKHTDACASGWRVPTTISSTDVTIDSKNSVTHNTWHRIHKTSRISTSLMGKEGGKWAWRREKAGVGFAAHQPFLMWGIALWKPSHQGKWAAVALVASDRRFPLAFPLPTHLSLSAQLPVFLTLSPSQ